MTTANPVVCTKHRDSVLDEVQLGDITVDWCKYGCIHFDKGELPKFTEYVFHNEGLPLQEFRLPARSRTYITPGVTGWIECLMAAGGVKLCDGFACSKHRNRTMKVTQEIKPILDLCPEGCVHFDNGELCRYITWRLRQLGHRPNRTYAKELQVPEMINPRYWIYALGSSSVV